VRSVALNSNRRAPLQQQRRKRLERILLCMRCSAVCVADLGGFAGAAAVVNNITFAERLVGLVSAFRRRDSAPCRCG
jgi:hypothetical protein